MVRFHDDHVLVVIFAIAAIVGLISPLVLVRSRRRSGGDPFRIADVEDRGPEVSGYMATYLLPFVTVATPNAYDLAGYGLFVALMAIIYLQSEMVQINPTFYLIRWRVYAFSSENDRRFYVITKSRPIRASTMRAWRISDDVLMDTQLGG